MPQILHQGNLCTVADPGEDVDYGTRAYLRELRELRAGNARDSGSALVTIHVRHAGSSAHYHAVFYSPDAEPGDRAMVVVPIEADPRLDAIPEGAEATFYGTLQPAHALAMSIGEDLYFPIGPTFDPGPLVPRFGVGGPPSSLSTLFGYLRDARYWKTRSVLPAAAVGGGLTAIAEQSLFALLVCVAATCWFVVILRRWRSTHDPFDDGSGPIEL